MAYKDYSVPKVSKWESIGGATKDGKKNPTQAEGYYIRKETNPDRFNPGQNKTNIIIRTATGDVGINGSKFLVRLLEEQETQFASEHGRSAQGAMMLIRFTGLWDSGKGNPMKTYSIQFDAEDTIDVSEGVGEPVQKVAASYEDDIDTDIDTNEDDIDTDIAPPPRSKTVDKAKVNSLLAKRK